MSSLCIVIPVYKLFGELSAYEKISWNQCLHVLGKYEVCLVCPVGLRTAEYTQALAAKKIAYRVQTFRADYFAGIDGYNRLLLARVFFACFTAFDYILLYQLDAFVFEDNLTQWMALNYSYIGAPWFEGYHPQEAHPKLWKVGNGGFTLRKVADCLRVLHTFSLIEPWETIIRPYTTSGGRHLLKSLPRLGAKLLAGNNTFWLFNNYHQKRLYHQEDYFWGVFCAEKFSWYKVPSAELALSFSFEVLPQEMYKLNAYRLPTGCHAWERYDLKFWQPIIEGYGHII